MALTLVLILFLHGLRESEALSVKGKVGKTINIACSHSNAWYNIKYFCKEKCRDEDILIKSSSTNKPSKYKIEDKGNNFVVTISDLVKKDSGTYWCGIERVGYDTFNEVSITVKEDEKDPPKNNNASFSRKEVYIGPGLGMVALVLAIVLLVVVKHQRRIIHSSSAGKNPETIYTTLSVKKEDGNHDTPASLAIEDHGTNCRTKNSAENAYSNVSPQPQNQTDDLCYSTVRFVKHSDVPSTIVPHSATE